MFNIKISSWPQTIVARKNETVLEAALREGVPYPHNCRSGECGECKTKLLNGDVKHDPYSKSELSDSERKDGYVLACRSRPTSDVEVAFDQSAPPTISIPVKHYKAQVRSIERLAHNVTCVRVSTSGKTMKYLAGQYADLSIGKLPDRSFSMANSPGQGELEFHIRHVPDGLVSGYVSQNLGVGEKIFLKGPYGTSYFRDSFVGTMILVAGGTGLAPVLSILKQALEQDYSQHISVYFGVQQERDIYCEQELQQIAQQHSNVTVQIVLSNSLEQRSKRTGFLHDAIDQDFKDLTGAKVYAAGPPPMIDALQELVLKKGVNEQDIHCDPFTAAVNTQVIPKTRSPGRVLSRLFG